jgi:hypothetical protein
MQRTSLLLIASILLLAGLAPGAAGLTLDGVIQAYEQFARQAVKLAGAEFTAARTQFEKSLTSQSLTMVWHARPGQRIWYDQVSNTSGCVIMLNSSQYAAACPQLGIEHATSIPEGVFRDLLGAKQYRLFDTLAIRLSTPGNRFRTDVRPGDLVRLTGQVTAITVNSAVDNTLQIAINVGTLSTGEREPS